MRKLIFVALVSAITLWSCDQGTDPNREKPGKGPITLGGVFRMNEVEDFRNLYPHDVTEVVSHRITNQIYEGLLKYSQKDLEIIPSIAESWEVNEDATKFTFHLRKGVKYHDDPCFDGGKGREVTAEDFKKCYTLLCTSAPQNQGFWVFKNRVVGADEYYQSTMDGNPLAEGVTGIKVIDKYTLQIDLEYSFSGFLQILCTAFTWVFPMEAVEKYGIEMRVHCVGTGPFKVKTIREGEAVILSRFENYWDKDEWGNEIPYLDRISFSFLKEKKSELLEFKKGHLDMVFELPIEMIDEVMGEFADAIDGPSFEVQVTPALALQYYGFQHQSDLFSNKLVRQAFNYAIDRESIVTYTLQGEGRPAIYGMVPPAFNNYDFENIDGYNYDPDKARLLLAEAGYPNGNNFPKLTLSLNSGGSRNVQIAEVIQKQLKESLNIDVVPDVIPRAQHLDNLETGKTLFWRTGWIADYPDPENFLNLLYSPHIPAKLSDKSYINSVRYRSAEFDSLFSIALREVEEEKRLELYKQADQIAMDDAAIMPIYYSEHYRLLQLNVRNFDINPMEYRDLSRVYFAGEKEKKAKDDEKKPRKRPSKK
ncbi:MAG: ABC transporter substrate-binding protein [Flavobacteriales bacterium]|nr:ABC transporter substrate-binding protein [Flavobacteriales bacterium]